MGAFETDPGREFLRGDAASFADCPPCTIGEGLAASVRRFGGRIAVSCGRAQPREAKRGARKGPAADRRFAQQWTFADYRLEVEACSKALLAAGIRPHEAVLLCGANHPCWAFAALGTVCIGAVAAGVYPTYGAAAREHIVRDSGARIAFVDTAQLAKRFAALADSGAARLRYIVQWGEAASMPRHPLVLSYQAFIAKGDGVGADELRRHEQRVKAGHAALLTYTSGTTGPPKGCMLSHDNVQWAARAAFRAFDGSEGAECCVSYLSLAHIAALLVDVFVQLLHGGHCHFAPAKGDLMQSLDDVRPTLFFGVPPVWERIAARVRAAAEAERRGGWRGRVESLALAVGEAAVEAEEHGRRRPMLLPVARLVALRHIRAALGLERCRTLLSAAAPMRRETLRYFASLDLPIMEVYGMSECAGPHAACLPNRHRIGAVGVPLPGQQLRVSSSGELLVRGRNVMMGYWRNHELTQGAIDGDGWLRTGDLGRVDHAGMLWIDGRCEEVIELSGGRTVLPGAVEDRLLAHLRCASQAMVVGHGKPHLCVLLTLKTVGDDDGVATGQLAPGAAGFGGSAASTVDAARRCAQYNREIAACIARANALADHASERVRRHAILPRDFSVATGELTPTLKLMRRYTAGKHAELIQTLYEGSAPAAAAVAPKL
eukprot:TRINITY_DN5686_c1_g1_i11.p1 TRINITY_DN5686_c1_g1~~TRINITY_DN5686_c1_g1_i11.p1  ORF type:complete len:669 (+),score=167.95 TRINITY_DN5686_c1_g1_i11:26-2008(+)